MRPEHWLYTIPLRLRSLFRRDRAERELDDEIRFHLDQQIAESISNGLAPDEARCAALRAMEGLELHKEECRDMRRVNWIEDAVYDFRFALRMMRKSPGFTAVAVLTLALGIGAHTAVWSFSGFLFDQQLPVRDSGQIASVTFHSRSDDRYGFSYPGYIAIRGQAKSFETLAAHYSTSPLHVLANGSADEINGAVVSANYFPMLGIQPRLGRFFLPEEDSVADRNPVAVISYDYWHSHFAGTTDAISQKIRINGVLFDIIGIAPQNFRGVEPPLSNDIWIPTAMLHVGYRWCDSFKLGCATLQIMGRLALGSTTKRAQEELSTVAASLAAEYKVPPEQAHLLVEPGSGAAQQMKNLYGPSSRLLLAASAMLLLVVAVNIAGLLVARAEARRKEIAIRVAIGSGRARLIRQWITESLILALVGGAGGLVVWVVARNFLVRLYSTDSETGMAQHFEIPFNADLVVYTLGITVVLGLLFGVLPAIEAARKNPIHELKDGGSREGSRRTRLRAALVTAQIALTLPLVIGAGLLSRSTATLLNAPSFDPTRIALVRLRPRLVNYTPNQAQGYIREVQRRLLVVPGVQSVSLAEGNGAVWQLGDTVQLGLPAQPGFGVDHHDIAPGYFQTLGLPFLAGRDFDMRDVPSSPRVAITNDTLAARLWPGQSPIGRSLLIESKTFVVVGEVRNVLLHNVLDAPEPAIYVPFWQNDFQQEIDARVCIRVAANARAVLPMIRQAATSADPNVPVTELTSLADQINTRYFQVFLAADAMQFAGALALFLSALGLYAVLTFVVSGRTREIGIRVALGAQTGDVMRMVLGQGARLALYGVAIGGAGAMGLTGLLAAWLYGVPARDPVIFFGAGTLLLTVALAACYIPARRATRVDPMVALRND